MSPVKRFLILYVIAYLIVATGINMLLGPPTMSKEYLATYKADHNRYIETTKNKQYTIWKQRPQLVDFDSDENVGLQGRIDFIDEYVGRAAFQQEQSRRDRYDLIFDFFNTLMVIVLVTRFARKPLSGIIDTMIDTIRTKFADAEAARQHTGERLDAAQHKIKGLAEDHAGYEEFTEERIENIRRDAALFTGESVSLLNKETANRKRFEEDKAKQQIKQLLVEAAIEEVSTTLQHTASNERDNDLIEQFMVSLEEKSS